MTDNITPKTTPVQTHFPLEVATAEKLATAEEATVLNRAHKSVSPVASSSVNAQAESNADRPLDQ